MQLDKRKVHFGGHLVGSLARSVHFSSAYDMCNMQCSCPIRKWMKLKYSQGRQIVWESSLNTEGYVFMFTLFYK